MFTTTKVQLSVNGLSMPCSRCDRWLLTAEADFHTIDNHRYALCRLCTLREVPLIDGVIREKLDSAFPRKDPTRGKEITPYPYQVLDALFVAHMRSVLISSQMGTGKTPTTVLGALSAAWELGMGVMAFVPSSVKWNWKEETERWALDPWKVKVIEKKVFWRLPEPGELIVSSYAMLPGEACKECKGTARRLKSDKQTRTAARIMRSCTHKDRQVNPLPEIDRPYLLFADEIHMLQRDTSLRRHYWDQLAGQVFANGGRLAGLTGTVLSNKPGDLKSIMKALLIFRGAFRHDDDFDSLFWEWYENAKGDRDAPQGDDRLLLLRSMRPVRTCRLRKHVLKHLPPVRHLDPIKVELDERALAEIQHCVQRLLGTRRAWQDVAQGLIPDYQKRGLDEDEKDRRRLLFEERVDFYCAAPPWHVDEELRMAVEEAMTSKHTVPTIGELSKLRKLLSMAKIDAARKVIEKHEREEEPLVVFSDHTDVLSKLFEGREGWQILRGSTPAKKRQQMINEFQSGKLEHGLGVSIRAGAVGITLTRAAHMLFVDWHWNPSNLSQAIDRLNRPGAEIHDAIYVMRLQADHAVDRLVVTTVQEKLKLQLAVEDDEASMAGVAA
jgi:superfamily II DNA or RNA helicase